MSIKKQKQKIENIKKIKTFVFFGLFSAVYFYGNCVFASEINSEDIISLVNDSRKNAGKEILIENDNLVQAAKYKAHDMIENNYFAHNSPQGKTPWYWIDRSGYNYKFAGENLAINFEDTENQHRAWMNSQTHRENILNDKYKEIGVAVEEGVINGHKAKVSVQMFASDFNAIITAQKQLNGEVASAQDNKLSILKSDSFPLNSGVIEGRFDFNSSFGRYGNLVGWFLIAVVAISIISADVIIAIHRKHIKPILVQQSLKSRHL